MDRLDELQVFVAILDAGSLSRAGRRLGKSPAAMTRSLANLEARAGQRLVERTTRKLAATEAGRRLADQARRMLADYAAAIEPEGAGGPLRGSLAVTAPLVFGRRHVTRILTSFLDMNPMVSGELLLSDRNLDLIDDHLDVAVRIGLLADSSLAARRVGEVGTLTVAAPRYLVRAGAPESPADLDRHQIILTTGRSRAPDWRFRGLDGRELTVRLTPRLSISDVDATLEAVREGHGIGRALSYQVAEDLAAGRLVRLLPAFEPEPLPVQLVTQSMRLIPARVRAFLDHAAAAIGALPVAQPDAR